jgi:hypothetical protein
MAASLCIVAHHAQGRHGSLHRHRLDRLPGRGDMHLTDDDIGGHRGRVL